MNLADQGSKSPPDRIFRQLIQKKWGCDGSTIAPFFSVFEHVHGEQAEELVRREIVALLVDDGDLSASPSQASPTSKFSVLTSPLRSQYCSGLRYASAKDDLDIVKLI